jgi:hypothetical protein
MDPSTDLHEILLEDIQDFLSDFEHLPEHERPLWTKSYDVRSFAAMLKHVVASPTTFAELASFIRTHCTYLCGCLFICVFQCIPFVALLQTSRCLSFDHDVISIFRLLLREHQTTKLLSEL